ncbi:MAG: hypothetical protein WCO94_05775 [Verrucomicrobiota bacterium]
MKAAKREERTSAVPVRLDKEMRASLRRAARRANTNASALIRFAIVNQLEEMARTGELRVSARAA